MCVYSSRGEIVRILALSLNGHHQPFIGVQIEMLEHHVKKKMPSLHIHCTCTCTCICCGGITVQCHTTAMLASGRMIHITVSQAGGNGVSDVFSFSVVCVYRKLCHRYW